MALTAINSEDRLVQQTFAEHLEKVLRWVSIYAHNPETFGPSGTRSVTTTLEETFAQLVALAATLDAEQRRAAEEGLSEEELALFDLLFTGSITKADRERLKQASRGLLASLRDLLRPMQDWTQKSATQAQVRVFILDNLYRSLPRPPFTEAETEDIASRVYEYVWQRSASGQDLLVA